MVNQNYEKSIQENFKKMTRGLMQPSHKDVTYSYKKLYETGPPLIPLLKEKIYDIDWSNSKYKELSTYMSGLFSLLHDIDEDEANLVGNKIIENGCPEHIKAIIKSIFAFSQKNYKRYQIKGIDIFEHKLIKSKCDIQYHIKKWLNYVPETDLADISRIYIINRDKINASGTYTPILKIIALLWENHYKEKSFMFKISSIYTEEVLYHEIGHHANNHTFGTDPDQEREADKYAFKIMRKTHPYLAIVTWFLS